jgi:hypothetical protein
MAFWIANQRYGSSATNKVALYEMKYADKHIVLVETPGFDGSQDSDEILLKRISEWLRQSMEEKFKLAGNIYLNSVLNRKREGPALSNLKLFRQLCDSSSLLNSRLCTSYWHRGGMQVDERVALVRHRATQIWDSNRAERNDQFVWTPTWCIDESSNAELSEAINSMYECYEKSREYYEYVHDVSVGNTASVHKALSNNPWFMRRWIVQEVHAPGQLYFIYEKMLRRVSSSRSPVPPEMSWASHRRYIKTEDKSYSLMGLTFVANILLWERRKDGGEAKPIDQEQLAPKVGTYMFRYLIIGRAKFRPFLIRYKLAHGGDEAEFLKKSAFGSNLQRQHMTVQHGKSPNGSVYRGLCCVVKEYHQFWPRKDNFCAHIKKIYPNKASAWISCSSEFGETLDYVDGRIWSCRLPTARWMCNDSKATQPRPPMMNPDDDDDDDDTIGFHRASCLQDSRTSKEARRPDSNNGTHSESTRNQASPDMEHNCDWKRHANNVLENSPVIALWRAVIVRTCGQILCSNSAVEVACATQVLSSVGGNYQSHQMAMANPAKLVC